MEASHSCTLVKCLEISLRILAPIAPYLSDDLYTRLAKKGLPGFHPVLSLLEVAYPMPYEVLYIIWVTSSFFLCVNLFMPLRILNSLFRF